MVGISLTMPFVYNGWVLGSMFHEANTRLKQQQPP
jgi:hypothetical protein